MIIRDIEFLGSFPSVNKSPITTLPEYAFIGRSNVGKSTLINFITDRKDLAKVSSTPGKTQLINFFEIDESWHLVDLPGYGYAKSSKKKRSSWGKMIVKYLVTREQLQCAFLLIDSRIPLQEIDHNFINWLGEKEIPFVIVYTKIDGVRKSKLPSHLKQIEDKLLEEWTEIPKTFKTSSSHREGREELLEFIGDCNEAFEKK